MIRFIIARIRKRMADAQRISDILRALNCSEGTFKQAYS